MTFSLKYLRIVVGIISYSATDLLTQQPTNFVFKYEISTCGSYSLNSHLYKGGVPTTTEREEHKIDSINVTLQKITFIAVSGCSSFAYLAAKINIRVIPHLIALHPMFTPWSISLNLSPPGKGVNGIRAHLVFVIV